VAVPDKSGKNARLLGHIQPRIVSMASRNNGKIIELMVGDKGLEPLPCEGSALTN
jgi:hypothetical protein